MDKSTLKICEYDFEVFQSILNTGRGQYLGSDGKYHTVDLRINDKYIEVKNLLISESYSFQIGKINIPIQFVKCCFESNISFLSNIGYRQSLKFINCEFESEISLLGNQADVEINSCIYIKKISLGGGSSDFQSIEIKDSNIDNLEFFKCAIRNLFLLNRCSISRTLKIQEISSNKFEVFESTVADFVVENSSLQFVVLFSASRIGDIKFDKVSIPKGLRVESGTKINKLFFRRSNLDKFFIIENSVVSSYRNIESSNFFSLSVRNSEIQDFFIDLERMVLVEFEELYNSTLFFKNTLSEKNILRISHSQFSSIKFEKVTNYGMFEFNDVTILDTGLLSIRFCNLGKAKILNCKFSKTHFEFENSELSEIFISDTDFPPKVFIGKDISQNQARLVFGQLQKVFDRQGDSIRHFEYQAREVESYYRLIKWISSKNSWRQFPWINFSKLNLFFNYISNNFGRSWIQGIIFTVCIGLIFFSILTASTSNFTFSLTPNFDLLGPFLKFLNPLRHFEIETLYKSDSKQDNIQLSRLSYLWDFLGRIFVAYGYYQTIQAFRRFGRK